MLLLGLMLGAVAHGKAPDASVSYAFEMLALDLGRLDDALEAYDFAPVGREPLLSHGVRGTFVFDDRYWAGLNVRTAVATRGRDAVVPTVVQGTWTGLYGAYSVAGPVRVGGDVGFAAVSEAVGSVVQGGALVYLGPYLQPRATWRIVDGPGVVEVSAGWMLHTPIGRAHDNVLWEEPFDRRLVQGFTLAVQSGMGTRGWP